MVSAEEAPAVTTVADDLAAEVFTVAFAQRQRYDLARDCARPWLYGIATNLVGSYRRREQRRYRALARMDARAVAPSDEDLVAERVSAAAAGPPHGPHFAAGVRSASCRNVFADRIDHLRESRHAADRA